jgi:hypothetical protein
LSAVPRHVHTGNKHLELLGKGQFPRFACARVPVSEVHHCVSMPIREHIKQDEGAHQYSRKGDQRAFDFDLQP